MTIKELTVAGLCMLLATACNTTGQNNGDNPSNTDSVATAKNAEADGAPKVLPYMSPDAALFDIRGNVKEVKLTSYNCGPDWDYDGKDSSITSFVFDGNKHLIFDGKNFPLLNVYKKKEVRNDKGQLTAIESDSTYYFEGEVTFKDHQVYKFEYNEEGRPTKREFEAHEANSTRVYTYNEQGDLVRSVTEGSSESTGFTDDIEFEVLEKDRFGNWTKRKVFGRYIGINAVTDEQEYSEREWTIEVRQIVYQ